MNDGNGIIWVREIDEASPAVPARIEEGGDRCKRLRLLLSPRRDAEVKCQRPDIIVHNNSLIRPERFTKHREVLRKQ